MAEHLIFRYDFVATVGSYSSGDWIESRYDTTSGAVKVYDDSGEIGTGPNLGIDVNETNYVVPPATYRTTNAGYSFCESTTLIYFDKRTSFPYVSRKTEINSPSCAVTPPSCDILLTVSSITPATDTVTADGEVVVSATSSNGTIKYGLFDFDYSVQGQTSGTFSGLYPATYAVFAKDSSGCVSSTLVFLGVAVPTYGLLYRMDYKTLDDDLRRVEIFEAGFSGSVTEIKGGSENPCRINWRAENTEKTYPVIASTLEVDLFNEESFGQFYFQNLFTQDDQKYKVIHYKHNGSDYVTNWTGFILPSLYQEQYIPLPYTVTIQASDNLAILSEKLFLNQSGNSFSGRKSVLHTIAACLAKTGVNSNIRVACHIFETNHTNDSTHTPLEQTFVHTDAYLDDEGNPKTCRDVLEYILAPFAARIVQASGYWWVIRIEEQVADFDYVEFSFDEFDITQTDDGTYSPVKNIRRFTTSNSASPVDNSFTLDTVPAAGKIRFNYELGYLGGLLKYGNFAEPKYRTGTVIEGAIEGVPGSGTAVVTEGPIIDRHFNPDWLLVKNGDDGGVNVVFQKVRDEGWVASLQGGNGDSYISYKTIPVTYTSSDYVTILIRFKLSQSVKTRIDRTPGNTLPTSGPRVDRSSASGAYQTIDPPFTKVKWSAQLGDRFLLQYGGGVTDSSLGINENYISEYNEFVEIKLDRVLLPDVSEATTENLKVRVYSVNPLDADVVFFEEANLITGLKAIDTTELYLGKKVILSDPLQFGVIMYYELANGTDAESSPDVIRPTDYNGTTNPKVWKLIAKYSNNSVARYYDSIDISNVQIEFYPGGITPLGSSTTPSRTGSQTRSFVINDVDIQKDLVTPYTISSRIRDELDVNLFHGDRPDIQNARYIYENYFSLSDGTPTEKWTRDGQSEELPIQRILAQQIIGWYKQPTWRLTGRIKRNSGMSDVTPIDCFYTSTQEGKYYLLKSVYCHDKMKEYDVEMEEIDDDVAEPGRGFTVGFTTGFNA